MKIFVCTYLIISTHKYLYIQIYVTYTYTYRVWRGLFLSYSVLLTSSVLKLCGDTHTPTTTELVLKRTPSHREGSCFPYREMSCKEGSRWCLVCMFVCFVCVLSVVCVLLYAVLLTGVYKCLANRCLQEPCYSNYKCLANRSL